MTQVQPAKVPNLLDTAAHRFRNIKCDSEGQLHNKDLNYVKIADGLYLWRKTQEDIKKLKKRAVL